jgi:hypothetical protein
MTYDELLFFVVKQRRLTNKVVTCYEAGAFAFHLHPRCEEFGIKNYVVHPQDRDERGKGVMSDRLDAAALCQRLDRYEWGSKKAFSVVRISTVDEGRERAIARARDHGQRFKRRIVSVVAEVFSPSGAIAAPLLETCCGWRSPGAGACGDGASTGTRETSETKQSGRSALRRGRPDRPMFR